MDRQKPGSGSRPGTTNGGSFAMRSTEGPDRFRRTQMGDGFLAVSRTSGATVVEANVIEESRAE